jgi:hypothetical protein
MFFVTANAGKADVAKNATGLRKIPAAGKPK